MENVVLERPPVSEAVVDLLDEPYEIETATATATASRNQALWIPVALVAIAVAAIASAYLAGIQIASVGP